MSAWNPFFYYLGHILACQEKYSNNIALEFFETEP